MADEELLTAAEHRAMELTVELWNLLVGEIVGHGRSRSSDLDELCRDIHAIQRTVLKQAAARAYPDRYRLLGGEVGIIADGNAGDRCRARDDHGAGKIQDPL